MLEKLNGFTFNHSDQADRLSDSLTADEVKEKFDSRGEEVRLALNAIVDALTATTSGDSGASTIGVTSITDLDGNTVQALLQSIRDTLKGNTGASFVGTSAIAGLSGSTVQALLQALKTLIDEQGSQSSASFVTKTELTNARKLSETGNFTGSWFGISSPAMADPGIAGVVQSHTQEFIERGINVKDFSASASDRTTTGSITSGSNSLSVASAIDFKVGQGVNIHGLYEVNSLNITAAATASGNCSLSLDGVTFTVALVNGDSANTVATKIRAAVFPGWTTGGSGANVTFTATTTGNQVAPTYSAGTTGAAGNIATTLQGTEDFITKISAINGTTLTLTDSALTSITGGVVAHDDSAAIMAAINSADSALGSVVIFPPGVYMVSSVTINKISIHLQGHGATIVATNRSTNVILLDGAADIKIQGFRAMTTFGIPNDEDSGYFIYGSGDRALISNNQVSGLGLCRIKDSKEVRVENNHCESNFDSEYLFNEGKEVSLHYGIMIRNCFDFWVLKNNVKNYARDGIKVQDEMNNFGEYGVIAFNTCDGMKNDDGIDIYNAGRHLVIHGNITKNCQKGLNIKVDNTTVFEQTYSERNIVTSNIVIGGSYNSVKNPNQQGINACSNYSIYANNYIEGISNGFGIRVGQSTFSTNDILIFNNEIVDCPNSYGIYVNPLSKRAYFSNNRIKNVGLNGMEILSGDFYLQGGEIIDCVGRGLNVAPTQNITGDFVINGLRIKSTGTALDFGLRFNPSNTGGQVTACSVSNVTTAFRDDTTGRLVIDRNNSWNTMSGATANRPGTFSRRPGTIYFDTDLSKNITWNGTAWTNMDGSAL
ncbi:hypothetical protein [Cohnella sp. JJ-181]|uniref:hypothetical protein n=1 Tax=Cohnella rhizoplanae TaxID=2974897 RepID=UPI0022FF5882|nr:hypothetical protein [Cohnella sp. JJ-181]CAI6073732.1 hypothetical protein COHCIP112018_02398 [Cohnella sp. JJ-181]